jgi:hypothetical protein
MEGSVMINEIVLEKRDAVAIWNTENISIGCSNEAEFLIIETPVNQK